jgi:hypothetical protein
MRHCSALTLCAGGLEIPAAGQRPLINALLQTACSDNTYARSASAQNGNWQQAPATDVNATPSAEETATALTPSFGISPRQASAVVSISSTVQRTVGAQALDAKADEAAIASRRQAAAALLSSCSQHQHQHQYERASAAA